MLVDTFDGWLRDVIDQCWLVLLLDAFVGGGHLQDDARVDEVLDDLVLLAKNERYHVILCEFQLYTHLARVRYQFKRDGLASPANRKFERVVQHQPHRTGDGILDEPALLREWVKVASHGVIQQFEGAVDDWVARVEKAHLTDSGLERLHVLAGECVRQDHVERRRGLTNSFVGRVCGGNVPVAGRLCLHHCSRDRMKLHIWRGFSTVHFLSTLGAAANNYNKTAARALE